VRVEDLSNPTPQSSGESVPGAVQKAFEPGDFVAGRYRVLSVIAAGGYGWVYKVHQVLMKKDLALKTLNPIVATEGTLLRLRKEAQLVSKLNHPNLVRAIDFAFIDGVQPFLVMEFVDGPTLAEYLKDHTRLETAEALQIFIPLCLALSYAHDQGIVHRDIKPSNIILAKDEREPEKFVPKIVDFGIAKLSMSEDSLTRTGDIFGTPLYMSPEQCHGTQVDARSDIYSLGCVIFEALTGAPPFRGNSPLETMMQHKSSTPLSLKQASLGTDFPNGLERCVAKMLAKEPRDRYQNLMDAADDLILIQAGQGHRTQATSLKTEALTQKKKANQTNALITLFVCGAALIGAICGAAVISYYFNTGSEKKHALTDKEQAEITKFLPEGLEQQQGFFAKEDKTSPQNLFAFAKDYSIGGLSGWEPGGKCTLYEAKGNQLIPRRSLLVFTALDDTFAIPYVLGRFHLDDLVGVIMRPSQITMDFSDRENEDIAVDLATRQRRLRLLSLHHILLSKRTLDQIGDLNPLRWLELSDVKYAKGTSLVGLTGEDIATHVRNLPRLASFKTSWACHLAPALKVLQSNNSLHQLSLAFSVMTSQEEYNLLHQFKYLDTLDLRSQRKIQWDQLPPSGLKRLCLEYHSITPSDLNALKRYQQLHELVISCQLENRKWKESEKKMIRAQLKDFLPAGFDLERKLTFAADGDEHSEVDKWFDPAHADPDQL